jgi:hypothetical protein
MNRLSAVAAVVTVVVSAACGEAVSPLDPSADHASTPAFAAGGVVLSSAPAGLMLPLRGRFSGTQSVTPGAPGTAVVQVSADGTATILGRFTITLPHTVTFATQSAVGAFTIVSANGDQITGTFRGRAQVGPIVSIVEEADVTGGTGRFAGATGSFRIDRVFNPVAGATAGSFVGAISAPNSGR